MGDATAKGEQGPAPWTALDLVVLVVFIYYFWLSLASALLLSTGFYSWYYGPDVVALATTPGETKEPLLRQLAQQRLLLWAAAIAFPFQLLTAPLFLARRHNARPEQMGLTTRGLRRSLLFGLLYWAALTPVVFGIYQLFLWLFGPWPGGEAPTNILIQVAKQPLSLAERGLLIFRVLIAAPALEELLFRGLLLPWCARSRWNSWAALAVALALAVGHGAAHWTSGSFELTDLLQPLSVLALAPLLWLVQKRSRSPEGPAMLGSAILFGFVHGDWPSPLPLLVLGVGLGVLARRTRSLAGPMLVHALFNSVTVVVLLGPW
jgi:membrane protease YdiL (CAAX protease family)